MNRPSRLLALAGCCALFLLSGASVSAQEVGLGGARPKITVASAVRARTGPQFETKEVARLKLGTVVSAVARSAEQSEIGGRREYWYRVELPGGGSAWVFGGLLADYDPARRAEITRRIIDERLKVETMEFEDGLDLYNFVSAALAETREAGERGELERARLHAVNFAARAVPHGESPPPPYRDFQRAHAAQIYYHELAGVWAVRPEAFWELETKYRGTAVGDRIAWDAAQALRPGECEGDAVCHFLAYHDTEGKYLSLYPAGAHAGEALRNIAQALSDEGLDETLKSRGGDQYQEEARAAVKKAVAELRAAVSKTTAAERAAVLERLDRLTAAGR